jgi:uncharacterized FlaG/YvyC family protein
MDIKGINIKGQVPHQAGEAPGTKAGGAEARAPEKRAVQAAGSGTKAPAPVMANKAVFAVDDNDKVVIRVIDPEGNVVKQIPPEEYMRTAEVLRSTITNLLNLEV